MLLPQKFGTLDIHATNALKIVGFKGIREIPKERAKEDYFEKYSGIDYLEYNALLTEIGKHYFVVSRERKKREMYPSEVDMALYMLDKAEPRITRTPEIRRLTKQEKIDKIMGIIEEILEGAITTSERPQVVRAGWAGRIRGSAKKLERNMRGLARQGNLTGMIGYYENAMKSFAGKRVAAWLDKYKMKTLENQHAKVKEIYNDC